MSFSSDDSDDDVPPPPPPPPPAPSAGKGQQRAPSAVAEEELEIQMTPTLESLMHRNAVDKAEGEQEVEINLENAAPSRGLESTAEKKESGDEAPSSGRKKKGLLAILGLLLIGGGVTALVLTVGKGTGGKESEANGGESEANGEGSQPPVATPTSPGDTNEEIAMYVLGQNLPSDSFAALSTEGTPQSDALNWVLTEDEFVYDWSGLSADPIDEEAQMDFVQRYVSATLYLGTDGASWNNNKNWMGRTNVCTWYGVGCDGASLGDSVATEEDAAPTTNGTRSLQDGAGVITSLVLHQNKLNGRLPSDLSALSKLESVEMHQNRLRGEIPASYFTLPWLRVLFLDANRLEGTISSDFGKLTNLVRLSLNDNRFSGTIPSEFGGLANLAMLWLFNNPDVTGEIPVELANLSKLGKYRSVGVDSFIITFNSLTHIIHIICISTEALALFNMDLVGQIPSEFGNLQNLKILKVENNNLDGDVPTELYSITSLEVLGVAGNANLTGTLIGIQGLPNLKELYIGDTNMTGPIPNAIAGTSLEIFLAPNANLVRSIPTSIGLLTNLMSIDVSKNTLTGPLPSEIGQLSKLENLVAFGNELTAAIPSEIGGLTSVKNVDFSVNKFSNATGLPSEIGLLAVRLVIL